MDRGDSVCLAGVLSMALALPAARAAHPILGSIDLYPYGNQRSSELTYWKGIVYIGAEGTSCGVPTVHAVDVSDPNNLVYRSSAGGSCKAYALKVVDDTLYVANWSTLLRTFDVAGGFFASEWVADPTSSSASAGLDAGNGRAYVTAWESGPGHLSGFYIVNTQRPHPANPDDAVISRIPITGYTGAVAVRGSYAYYTNGRFFIVGNISDEANPYAMTSIDLGTNQIVNGVVLRDHHAFVFCALGDYCFRIYDVTNPVSPALVGQYTGTNPGSMYLLGDYALAAGTYLETVDIANLSSPQFVTLTQVPLAPGANNAWEASVTGNGPYAYLGVSENYPNIPGVQDNYQRGKLFALEVLSHDPDNAGPGRWSACSLSEASFDTQYSAEALPTRATPAWQVFEGSETWASVADKILRIHDTGTGTNDRIRWWRNWDATNTRGTTVLLRARCTAYSLNGGPLTGLNNLFLEDGKYQEQFVILSDRIRANRAGLDYFFDGASWHTYRITTQGSSFKVYLDENATPILTGPLLVTSNRSRLMFGASSGPATQTIEFDYVAGFSNGAVAPPPEVTVLAPTVSVSVQDSAGKGSIGGINPATAAVHWSQDGGLTWNQSGGSTWDGEYQGDVLPTADTPRWTLPEGNGVSTSLVSGYLHIEDNSTLSGSKVKYARSWGADPVRGTTVLARARCTAIGGNTDLLGNLFVEDGARREQLQILPDRVVAAESGIVYDQGFDGTQWHVYRIATLADQFNVYLDESPTPILTGTMIASTSIKRVMFGSGASAGTQTIDFDYVRYSALGAFAPGQDVGGGSVLVSCSGQPGDYGGLVTAYSIPFQQGSPTRNRVRFSLRDLNGNTGWSPVYIVRKAAPPSPDFDGDHDVDQSDYAHLQECFSPLLSPPPPGCSDADLNQDNTVNGGDVEVFVGCLAGANRPPDC